jgi:NADH dehydrogenase
MTPHVVIVGGGFAGITAAKRLAHLPIRLTLVDRRNHHVFQPLLYQVATAALSPAQIAAPIRRILSRYRNAEVLLGEVARVDVDQRQVVLTDGAAIGYDYLILAPGATHSYFGHEEWAAAAPGLKTIEDALTIRTRFLLAFERAEREKDPEARRAELTFVIVGGGPTGVELAGAMIEIARSTIPRDFRAIDTTSSRVILVEAMDRVLGGYPKDLSDRAAQDLRSLGVEVRLNCRVTDIDQRGVTVQQDGKTERIAAGSVTWAAGVTASRLGAGLGAPLDKSGRVIVQPDLSIAGHPEVFVTGDLARVEDPATHAMVPGVAPAAIQMGKYAAGIIKREVREGRTIQRPAFKYLDKGVLATIGRAKAVADIHKVHLTGFVAWLIWAVVHIVTLINFRTRITVMIEWAWYWFFYERGARLITNESSLPVGRRGVEGRVESASAQGTRTTPV